MTPPRAPRCPVPPTYVPEAQDTVGLAFSGGGIRSASFNLGVLQGLASRNALWMFDYLSTVSGGGFIGAWWSAWLSREKRKAPWIFPEDEELEPGRRAKTAVLLHGDGTTSASPAGPDGSRIARREDPIHFLRLFSNYLTPKRGAFSPDTWRMIAYYTRGLLFTWIVLLPLLLAVVMAGQWFYTADGLTKGVAAAFLCEPGSVATPQCADMVPPPTHMASLKLRLSHLAKPAAVLATAYATATLLWLAYASSPAWLALLSFVVVGWLAQSYIAPFFSDQMHDPFYAQVMPRVVLVVALAHLAHMCYRLLARRLGAAGQSPVHAAARAKAKGTAAYYRGILGKQQAWLLRFMGFAGALLVVAGFGHDVVDWMVNEAETWTAKAGWAGVAGALISAGYTVLKAIPSTEGTGGAAPKGIGSILVAVAPPLMLLVLALGLAWVSHRVLSVTTAQPDLGGVAALARVAACLAVLQVIFAIVESFRDPAAPAPVSSFLQRFVPQYLQPGTPPADWIYLFSPRGWVRIVVLVVIAVLVWSQRDNLPAGLIALVAVPVSISMSASWAALGAIAAAGLVTLAPRTLAIALGSARPAALLSISSGTSLVGLLGGQASTIPDSIQLIAPLWIALLIGFVICMGWLADPNLLSLHGFYKGRLSRAYLGASNTARGDEEITDAAPGDDVNLTAVWNHDAGAPYHLVNTTLSLVGGSDLAMSQRSAENFVLSRYACGSARAGYRCTGEYMAGELSLATAVAISGAAVSPNMGSQTPSAALALFLSLFNLRLGFWAPTPSGRRWSEPYARLWPFYVLRETLSNTGQIGTYCYLTDGGHFDNTGLYALVERGCRYIVVCDCGADPRPGFEDIGGAIRRCRIDFGAEIDLKIDRFVDNTTTHVVWGTITYQPEHLLMLGLPSTVARGVIGWIKPAVAEGDAVDVQQYRLANAAFPQQSTADQWYDESQFESYRRLGYDSARAAFPDRTAPSPLPPLPSPGDFAGVPPWFDSRPYG
jgi:hypothetical protein